MSDHKGQRLRLQIELLRLYSRVIERPWGLLFYNRANPTYYEANGARLIRTHDPDAAIEDIISFYQRRRLTPRVILDERTRPADMQNRLLERGFECGRSHFHIMVWTATQAGPDATHKPDAAVRITRATQRDLPHLVAIQAEDDPWARPEWLHERAQALLAAGPVQIYLAWIGSVPASTALVYLGDDAGLVESVVTRPSYRGRGLASALIRQIQADAQRPLLLDVEEEDLLSFYTHLGFSTVATSEEYQCWLPAA